MKKRRMSLFMVLVMAFVCMLPNSTLALEALERISLSLVYDGSTHNYNNFKVTLKIDGVELNNLPMPPVLINDHTYVPVKEIFEHLGAVVDWKPDTREVYIGYGDSMIVLKIGSNVINNNGEIVLIPVTPRIINDKTMIPVKYAAEAFGFQVSWYDATKTVSISTDNAGNPPSNVASPAGTGYEDADTYYDDSAYRPVTLETSVDNSTSEMTAMSYPETSISKIDLVNNNTYIIRAESEISRVEKMLLPDNRFVLDIYDSVMNLPEKSILIPDNPYISGIRAAQNQITPVKITRVVFDLLEPAGFSVAMSPDRKSITFSFESNYITGVTASSDGAADYIRIEGTTTPVVSVFPLNDPERLVIDLSLSVMLYKSESTFNGRFISNVRTSQFDAQTSRVVIDLRSAVGYNISYEDNATVIKLYEPNYRNIQYQNAERTVVIPKPPGVTINAGQIEHTDLYYQYKYMLTLPVDISGYIGYGEMIIKDDYVNSIEINTVNGRTYLTINERQVLAVRVTEDSSNIYIKLLLPREVYDRIVVLDPGHGGTDPGATDGVLMEKNLTLDIVLKIISLIEADGRVKVYSTRVDNANPLLTERADFANSIGDLFVSVHINSFTNPNPNGTEVIYYRHDNDGYIGITSEKVASIMLSNLLDALGTVDRKVKTDALSVLKRTKMPAVLCEIEFVSNPAGAARLATEEFRWQAASAIYKSILEVFDIYKPAR